MKYLSYGQRLQIEALYKVHIPVWKIAKEIGCCRSTVYKELHRGVVQLVDWELRSYVSYSADVAQQKHDYAQTSKGRPLKIGGDRAFAAYIEHCIRDLHYSPAAALAAARRTGRFDTDISINTLYSYIYNGYLGIGVQHLIYGRRKRKKEPDELRPPLVQDAPSIEQRPGHINDRSQLGHWEMDCVCGKQRTPAALLVLTERASRYELIYKLPNKKAATVCSVLDGLERDLGGSFRDVFQSITVDNGSEFRDYHGLCSSLMGGKRTEVYYCHPYRSGERGSNENANRIIRRFVPKGTDIGTVTVEQVQQIQDWMNHYPRAVLGWACPDDFQIFTKPPPSSEKADRDRGSGGKGKVLSL